jgi:hypothetical protein
MRDLLCRTIAWLIADDRIDCDLPDGWTLDTLLLRILDYVCDRLCRQEVYRYRLRSCIVLTRTEACYIGWWHDDDRLAFCRDPEVGRYGTFMVSDGLGRTTLIEIPAALDLAAITLPLVCTYSVQAHFLCGRCARIWLSADGVISESTRWIS